MARFGRKRLGLFLVILILVIAVGYVAKNAMAPSSAVAPDSTSDSTVVKSEESEEDEDEKKEPDPVPVEIAVVKRRAISSYYHTTATLDPEREVSMLSKVAGEVDEILVEEGDVVQAGQVICRLEGEVQRVALDEARINMEQSKREFERIKPMFDQKIISDKEFSDAKYQYEVAQNKYDAALVQYEYTKIRSPFDGIVTKRHVELGQSVTVGAQLFEVIDPDPMLVRMYLPENEVRDIHVGQQVTIRPDNAPDVALTGTVVRISPEVDERSGTVKVTAETRGAAMPGSFARVKIVTDTRNAALAMPRRGLVSDAGELYVFLAQADSVRKAPVSVGYQDENFAEVIDGVADGDSVVVVGTGGLRTGTKIKVVDPTMQQSLTRTDETDATP